VRKQDKIGGENLFATAEKQQFFRFPSCAQRK